jgi:hypothetical protein
MFRLYDPMGRLVCEKHLVFDITDINTSALLSGLYFWDVVGNTGRAKAGKIVKTGR